ncbi:MAG: DUF1127 domain-containing protein [Pseudomonadota bacterium]
MLPGVAAPTVPGVLGVFDRMINVTTQRRALSELDDAALKDIGVSRFDAETEAARAPWDLPKR